MKVAILILFSLVPALAASAGGIFSVVIAGNTYSNISDVHISSGGQVVIASDSGIKAVNVETVPEPFLVSWITPAALAEAKKRTADATQAAVEKAIKTGCFREVDGLVYDIRKAKSGWVNFRNIKVLQVLDDGAILIVDPDNSYTPIFVKHLPAVGDTDYITFNALPAGTYSYTNKKGDDRTIRAYDFGRICLRDEIPEVVLSGQKAFTEVALDSSPQKDVLATLPDSDNLMASGSGFFISADGYLITNNHVVKGARRVKVKTADGIFPATVVRTDSTNDLALVKVSGKFKALPVSTSEVQLGDAVFTIGFPDPKLQGTDPKYTDGKISSLEGIQDDPTEFQISVPVQPGNSGGPLVDMAGNVKGVIVARLNDFAALRSAGGLPQNVNYAVKGNCLRNFLAAGKEVNLNQPARVDTGAAVANVRQAVAMVLIY